MTNALGQTGVSVQPAADLDFKYDKKLFQSFVILIRLRMIVTLRMMMMLRRMVRLRMMVRLTSEIWTALNAKEKKRLKKETVNLHPVKVMLTS